MLWTLSFRADPRAREVADRHYNRQAVGADQFVPPGACLVLLTADARALWITSFPEARYVKHAWAGAWMCSAFRNEAPDLYLSSALIVQAVSATLAKWTAPPPLGMVTFVDAHKTRKKRDPGRCFLRAGFEYAACLDCSGTGGVREPCPSCEGDGRARTKEKRLFVLQLKPSKMPHAEAPIGWQERLVS